MVFFLPSMWLFALLLTDKGAAAGGLIWAVGRIIYSISYVRNPASRGIGFTISSIAAIGMFLGAVYGLIKTLS
jgi:glutathione S-transferase